MTCRVTRTYSCDNVGCNRTGSPETAKRWHRVHVENSRGQQEHFDLCDDCAPIVLAGLRSIPALTWDDETKHGIGDL
jgi:hypothetical protein